MDLCFGEIVEPNSRAFYDDYDCENAPSLVKPALKWNNDVESFPESVDTFYVIEGANAGKIAKPVKKSSLCKVEGHNVELYKINDISYLCVSEESDWNYFSTITELLSPWIKLAKNCDTISLLSLQNDYKTETKSEEEFIIRSINSKIKNIPPLLSPNFISGISAASCSLRKLNDLSFSSYTIYVDIFDAVSVKNILMHLKKVGLEYDENIPVRSMNHESNLYM